MSNIIRESRNSTQGAEEQGKSSARGGGALWRIGHSSPAVGLPAALCALLFLASASRRCLTQALGDRLVFAATDEQ